MQWAQVIGRFRSQPIFHEDGFGDQTVVIGGDFIKAAIDIGANALVTGECSYNASQDAAEKGLAVMQERFDKMKKFAEQYK